MHMMGYAVYLMANVVHHSEAPHVHDSKFRTISLDTNVTNVTNDTNKFLIPLDTQDGLHKNTRWKM